MSSVIGRQRPDSHGEQIVHEVGRDPLPVAHMLAQKIRLKPQVIRRLIGKQPLLIQQLVRIHLRTIKLPPGWAGESAQSSDTFATRRHPPNPDSGCLCLYTSP